MREESVLPVLLLLLSAMFAVTLAQGDGRYRPPARTRVNDGRYNPANDGKYRPSNDGRYGGGNDGRYQHTDVKYVHDDRPGGDYSGDANKYRPDVGRSGPGGGASGAGGGAQRAGGGAQRAGGGAQRAGAAASRGSGVGAALGSGSGAGLGAGLSAGLGTGLGSGLGSGLSSVLRPALKPPGNGLFGGTSRPVGPKGKGTGEGGNGWRIIRQVDKVEQDGYHYLYETENGILAEESGRIEQLSPTDQGLRSKGFYEYTGDDGILYRVDYVADDNGFVAQGSHIPETPPHVIKLLAYLKEKGAL